MFAARFLGDVVPVDGVNEVVAALVNRSARHLDEPRKIDGIESAESLGDLTRRSGCGLPQLIAKLEISGQAACLDEGIDRNLERSRTLPRIDFLN